MSDRLQWFLELQDRLSGPSARMERQLGQLRASLKALDIQAKQSKLASITDPLKRQRAELQLQRDKLLLARDGMKKSSESASTFINKLHDLLHIGQIVGGALERVGHVVLELGSRFAKAASFRQGSMIGLEAILGKGAGAAFEQLEAMAGRIGKPIEQVVNLGRTLANVGVKAGDLEPMVRLIEDLDAMDPGAGEKLAGVIRGIFSTGMMKSGDVEALRGTILKPEKIFEEISRKMGGGPNRFAGKAILDTPVGVGKNIGVQTLLEQVLALEGGKAGSASTRGGQTLQARLDRVQTQIERMFSRLAGSRGVKSFSKVLDNLIDLFNPDTKTGKAMFDRLTGLSDLISKALEPLTGPEGKKRMEDFFDSMTRLLKGVVPMLERAARATEIFAGALAGKHAPEAPKTVGEELEQLSKFGERFLPDTLRSKRTAPFGTPFEQFSRPVININQQIDARGASKEDAEHIANRAAQKAKDAIADELARIATQAGAFAP